MPDDPNAGTGAQGGNSGAGSGGNAGAGDPPPNTPPGQEPGNAGGGSDSGGKTYNEDYVKKLRDECAAGRVARKELDDRLAAIESKDLSEVQKLQKQLAKIEAEREDERKVAAQATVQLKQAEILSAVTTAGAKKPGIVAKLVDTEATDLPKAIAALKKDNPELFNAPPSANAGAGGGGQNTAGSAGGSNTDAEMNAQLRRLTGRG